MSLSRSDLGVWMINLPRAVERRRGMDEQLQRMGLDYQLFEAIDGRAQADVLRRDLDQRQFERNVGRKMMWGEIGCYASHLGVWREFLDSQHQVALVLEDDVVFHNDFLPAVDLALAHGGEWDILKLNRIRAKLPISQGRLGRYQLNAYLGPATGTGAYLIHRNVAARLVRHMLPMTRPVDHELNRFFVHDYRLFGIEPFPSHVDDGGQSTITGQQNANVAKFKWWARLPYRWLKLKNYACRLAWLASRGRLVPRPKRDLTETSKEVHGM